MRTINSGHLEVTRTASGYLAVLRVQGEDGSSVGFVSRCSDTEAGEALASVGAFSFAQLARSIGKAAKGIARSKVFKTFLSAAKFLPPPISSVAHAADGAVKTLAGMRRGDPAARKVWEAAAAKARAQPTSPIAAGMRLAMDAAGPPVFSRTAARDNRMRQLVRAALAEL